MALSFEELWKKLSDGKVAGNTLYYHPCCDIWTSKSSKTKRATHIKQMPFRKILSILDKSIEDKKNALMVKMVEEGWRIPAILNEVCKLKLVPSVPHRNTFRLYNPYLLPHNLQATLPPRESPLSRQIPTPVNPESRMPAFPDTHQPRAFTPIDIRSEIHSTGQGNANHKHDPLSLPDFEAKVAHLRENLQIDTGNLVKAAIGDAVTLILSKLTPENTEIPLLIDGLVQQTYQMEHDIRSMKSQFGRMASFRSTQL